jgi:8-amino-7-oxononanoate synthase
VSWHEWFAARHDEIRARGQWRTVRDLDSGTPSTSLAGRAVVSYASNDYLGLTQHPAVRAAAAEALERYGTGSGASRLVVGSRPIHRELEVAIAQWKGTEGALLFPTGYMANLGVLSALGARPDTTILSDARNHASIIDGARLARAAVEVYAHDDLDELDDLLAESPQAIVVTDSVFSMDGDIAPVDELITRCRAHGALLVLDEAHAVLGPPTPRGDDVVVVGTLSKTLGSIGGFVAGPATVIDLLRNTARSFIFTTAPAPADSAAALAALRVVRSDEGDALRERLRANIARLRKDHPTPIVPVIVGDELATIAASDALLDRGLLVPAIRPPTVAPGTSRLRVALSAAHTPEQVDMLVDALRNLELIS